MAFAAGHRPCAECRRQRYNTLKQAWRRMKQQDRYPFADDMDVELHPARIDRAKKVTYEADLSSLPDGCFAQIEGWAHLVWCDALLLWTPEGYVKREERPRYIPEIHLSRQQSATDMDMDMDS